MANQEQLDRLLKQGVQAWNEWRAENPGVHIDLSEADLSEADLMSVNLVSATLKRVSLSNATLSSATFSGANLIGANLSDSFLRDADLIAANLSKADLSRACLRDVALFDANLRDADLIGANLIDADLSRANLIDADLSKADLSGAILYDANLFEADFCRVTLSGADLSGATLWGTVFGDVDLSTVKGLEKVLHFGPSTIGIDTIIRSQGRIPEIFLRNAGVPSSVIEQIPALIGSLKPIDYYSCFISYSSKDEALAKRLYADLQSQNVPCWFAPEDLKWGEKIRTGIDEAIRLHDKLLLILSKRSVASGWVEHEVKTALAKERKEKRIVLFPVRVDKAVLESPLSWAAEIRHERNIGDFTRWNNHDDYEKAFSRLLHDLKAEAQKMESRDTKT